MSIGGTAGLWEPAGTYLNTASYGLVRPPAPAGVGCSPGGAHDWRGGRTSWEHWGTDADVERTLDVLVG